MYFFSALMPSATFGIYHGVVGVGWTSAIW